ncbi:MAG: ComF family protein [Chloroflexota bacterium]|nr:ComF family protein [Chloroflexota bacterium]
MALLDLLLPPACAGCGRYGRLLCDPCVGSLRPLSHARNQFSAPDPGMVVGDALILASAAFEHSGVARRALQRLKYGGAGRLAAPLAQAAVPSLRELLTISGRAPLVPVPVHPQRLRQRGYNQAALLAAVLGREANLPVADVLVRRRATTRQHGLNRAARLHNLRGAFDVRTGMAAPVTAILVDDILTTSATLEACALSLQSAGAQQVFGFAIAREV